MSSEIDAIRRAWTDVATTYRERRDEPARRAAFEMAQRLSVAYVEAAEQLDDRVGRCEHISKIIQTAAHAETERATNKAILDIHDQVMTSIIQAMQQSVLPDAEPLAPILEAQRETLVRAVAGDNAASEMWLEGHRAAVRSVAPAMKRDSRVRQGRKEGTATRNKQQKLKSEKLKRKVKEAWKIEVAKGVVKIDAIVVAVMAAVPCKERTVRKYAPK